MDRRLLAPRWLALHAGVVVALVVCALLGYWQLDRARDLRAQSLRPAANLDAPPVALDSLLPANGRLDPADIGRPVAAMGSYDAAHQLLVPDRELDGTDGYLVVTPLRTDSGDALVVVRGWIPAPPGSRPPDTPAPPAGPLTVTGWLGESEDPPPLAASPPAGQVASVHLASLVNLVPYELYDGVVTLQTLDAASELALPPPPVLLSGGNWPLQNVFYALEWWIFGLAAVALWVSAVRRRPAPGASAADADHADRTA